MSARGRRRGRGGSKPAAKKPTRTRAKTSAGKSDVAAEKKPARTASKPAKAANKPEKEKKRAKSDCSAKKPRREGEPRGFTDANMPAFLARPVERA